MTPPDKSVPLRAVRIQAKCPVCGKPAEAKYQPFCTKRCADIDLGRWLKESYRVPSEDAARAGFPGGLDRVGNRPGSASELKGLRESAADVEPAPGKEAPGAMGD